MKKMNRWICMLLACLLMFGNFPMTALAAKDRTAVEEETTSETGEIIKLEKYEGDVEVRNASGKIQKIREGRRIYNGYKISTEEGYAWISLDENKLVKLDWYSSVYIRKDKKKLEVLLDRGSMFFNVDKPLEEDESLDIKTSGMSTGVRGTLGMVTIERKQGAMSLEVLSYVQLYEGVVGIAYYEEEAGIVTQSVEPGMVIDVFSTRINEEEALLLPVSRGEVTDGSLKENLMNIGFVAIELKEDEAVQERIIRADNGVDETAMKQIVDNAEEQLTKDQEEVRQLIEEIKVEIEREAAVQIPDTILAGNAAFTSGMTGEVDQVFAPTQSYELIVPEGVPARLEQKEDVKEPLEETVQEEILQKEVLLEKPKEETPSMPPVLMTEIAPPREESKKEPVDSTQSSNDSKPEQSKPEEIVKEYTVTFQYIEAGQNVTFAVMKVQMGKQAVEPYLMPTISGSWYQEDVLYDFGKPVTDNLTLIWK